jgi:hypothetical protein
MWGGSIAFVHIPFDCAGALLYGQSCSRPWKKKNSLSGAISKDMDTSMFILAKIKLKMWKPLSEGRLQKDRFCFCVMEQYLAPRRSSSDLSGLAGWDFCDAQTSRESKTHVHVTCPQSL